MTEVVKKRSSIMKDQLNTPKEQVIYWVEYLLRHNGASHLRSPIADMHW